MFCLSPQHLQRNNFLSSKSSLQDTLKTKNCCAEDVSCLEEQLMFVGSTSIREIIITSILHGLDQKNNFI